MQPCAEFLNVSKRFGTTRALDNVSVAFPAASISAIVGASGSGKSTLLQHINGLHRPDDGEVIALGERIRYDDLIALRRRIGYAVQGIALFPHLKVFENITLLARLAGWDETRIGRRADTLMQMVRLDGDLADRYPHMLSGGQQQRVGLCRALMLEPSLLLLDEPFSGLDPLTRGELQQEVLNLHAEEGIAVVVVTHDMPEARRLASQITVMRAGQALQTGTPNALATAPADPYVTELLGDAS